MDYNFPEIEKKWKKRWSEDAIYKVEEDPSKPKYYVLDMFPYPSGAGLHVGHPIGFVANDIVARYKRLRGFNVLHPMGFDAFGLPAEQYAVETGQHPAITTKKNINYFREQLEQIGLSYDWSREVKTSDPKFYKWTQWIFMQLFKSWYNPFQNKSEYIDSLIALLETKGSPELYALGKCEKNITAGEWRNYSEKEKQLFLMQFRLAYLDHADIWWCEALGTVLANDEVKDGVSERGGYPVEKIKMRQWFLRITEFADRLLSGLETLDWSDAMKEMQRNWIGRSEGALIKFKLAENNAADNIEIFTTRPDTIFGATFMVLAPEHELVNAITTAEYKNEVENYIRYVKSRSERDRMSEVKKVTGQFTGAYSINPFTNEKIPVYIAEYVLAGYGTGAIMAVPGNDERDHAFAEHFKLPIIDVVDQSEYKNASREDKIGKMVHSDFLNGMEVKDAISKMIVEIEKRGIGKRKINYRLRDAGFSRQRYWGEPFPVYYVDDVPYLVDEKELPVLLPDVESYKPSGTARSPLAALKEWVQYSPAFQVGGFRETDTMPGYAGSSWYFYRYMDPHNDKEFASREKINYWKNVDLYIGGTEHAVGHLLYSRMWNKFLFDMGWVPEDEPFKKLVNQGMVQGVSLYVYLLLYEPEDGLYFEPMRIFINKNLGESFIEGKINQQELIKILNSKEYLIAIPPNSKLKIQAFRIPNTFINSDLSVDILGLQNWREDLKDTIFFTEDINNKFYGFTQPEKMSKSKYNVVNPDDVIKDHGADCFRLYEMFMGPITDAKPWDTKGISGVSGFLRKLWRLFHDDKNNLIISDADPSEEELKVLHKTIKKAGDDIEKMYFNTTVSAFMICVNELLELKCSKKAILKPLLILIAPFAPFISEELWEATGEKQSVHLAAWPQYDEKYMLTSSFNYPVSINGKVRANIELPLDMPNSEIEKSVMALEHVVKWTEGKQPKKIIIVKGKIVNVVI